jgi:hypothetical protein
MVADVRLISANQVNGTGGGCRDWSKALDLRSQKKGFKPLIRNPVQK